mgnify:CR=1 FL=1
MMLRHLVFETDGGTKVEFMYNGKSVIHCINGVCSDEDAEITRRVGEYLRGIVMGNNYIVRMKFVGVEPYATVQVIKKVAITRNGPAIRRLTIRTHRAGTHPAADVVLHAKVDPECTKLSITLDAPSVKVFNEFMSILSIPIVKHLISEVVRLSRNTCIMMARM